MSPHPDPPLALYRSPTPGFGCCRWGLRDNEMGPPLRILLILCAAGALAEVQLDPQMATVLRGSNATFNCSVDQKWVVMSWLLNGNVVLTVSKDHGILSNDPRFTALNYSTDTLSIWEINILGVKRTDMGEVTCDVQNIQKVNAQLSVQVSGTVHITDINKTATHGELAYFQCSALGWYPAPIISWTEGGSLASADSYNISILPVGQDLFDSTSTLGIVASNSIIVTCLAAVPALTTPLTSSAFLTVEAQPQYINLTVVIAVTVTVGAVLLLAIIIIIVVCCYCQRKNSTHSRYEDEMRKAQRDRGQGADNLGYSADSRAGAANGQLNDSVASQSASINGLPIPNAVRPHDADSPGNLYAQHSGMKKARYATIV
ncbi:immunoglobulin superfamily member 5 isoform X2 [Paramormyrops kingsleyae]|uniref:immunoglobulin superfamily member 5 isoform X2 n=1 Tax=Paramormyrops kingsleyae TaxID=1676925 RepID=UPI003B96B568